MMHRSRNGGGQTAGAIAAVLVDLFLPDSRGIDTFDRHFRLAPQICG